MPCYQPFRGDSAQLLLFKIASCLEASGGGGVLSFNGRIGDVILSLADVAAVADDIYVNESGDTMTGALAMLAGSVALPSNTFSGDTNTGMYSPGADSVGFSTGGTLRLTVESTAVTPTVPILFPDGTAAAPSISFASDPDTGIYRLGANSFGSAAGGSVILATSITGINLTTSLAYQYNSFNVIRAQTALDNYFFGPSGNLTMTGVGNFAFGSGALMANTTGNSNAALGVNSLRFNTTGNNNSALGLSSLFSNTVGGDNSAVGVSSLSANTTGDSNSALGVSALQLNTTGSNNSAIGFATLFDVTTGSQNTAVGALTGLGITTGSNNTVLGANVAGLAAGLSNNIILADGAGVIRIQVASTGVVSIPIALTLGTAAPLSMTSGANQRAGDAVLVGGTVTVANTTVTANTRVFLTRRVTGGTIGFAVTYTVIAATSFTITSDNVLDTSTYSYLLIEIP